MGTIEVGELFAYPAFISFTIVVMVSTDNELHKHVFSEVLTRK